MTTRIAFSLAILISAALAAAEPPATKPSIHKIAPAEFEKLAGDKQNVILDVRTATEYAEGHIAGATNVDYRSKDFAEKIANLDKGKTYLVYCAVGGRSTSACEKMNKLDFPHLYNLDGGITRWQREGKPVEKE
jgi:rhodanese-related sulfurtransferase